ncbi:MAG: arginine--tRNA ligase [Pseudomonadales bacterium]|nr:arginine--tRNA ligase [Pseudomonadales bacterium]
MNLKSHIEAAFSAAFELAGVGAQPPVIKQSQRPEFGHDQANGIMGAAKKAGLKPRELAEQVVGHLQLPEAEKLEIAGPGFINIHLAGEFLASRLASMQADPKLGYETGLSRKIVLDYSAPNLAKEMHIGHLRSTSIGDAAARILTFQGHEVIRANHVGDWGAQFGSLLAYMDQLDQAGETLSTALSDLEKFYMQASSLFKSDEAFAAKARQYVVRLQSGDERCRTLWQQFITESVNHCQAVYEALNITLTRDDIKAESSYNDDLPVVVAELTGKGLITESDGAKCVFLDEFRGKDDKPLPAIVQKSDQGYPYLASDIAALRYRATNLKADAAYYFVDARQKLHLSQLFAIGRAAGYLQTSQDFRHLPFGVILKEDGKPFKTRDGADVKLADVVSEATERAFALVSEKNPALDEAQRRDIARVVGVGAVKYAELSKNRTTDYVFDWDTMLAFEGNTAPYLQYAYTRIRSIFSRSGIDPEDLTGKVILQEEIESQLAVKLLQFSETLVSVTEDFQANLLCNYLFELAGLFMSFYEQCPVLKAEPDIRASRLLLASLTARVLSNGLDLLGIETVEQM